MKPDGLGGTGSALVVDAVTGATPAVATSRILPRERIVSRVVHAGVRAAYEAMLRRIPEAIASSLPARAVGDALAVQNALLLVAGAVALEDETGGIGPATRDMARKLISDVDAIALDGVRDEMIVAELATGLVAFADITDGRLEPDTLRPLHRRIAHCADWLDHARGTRPFGVRDHPGIHAWNHSVVCALALAMCALDGAPSPERQERIEFGLDRLAGYFEHGLNAQGIPYEGLFYWGLCLRVIGLFGLVAGRDPQVEARYLALRERHRVRLQRVLDWIDAATFPDGRYLLSYNQSPYAAAMAAHGLLLFFGRSHPGKSFFLWSRLLGDSGDRSHGGSVELRSSCVFEAMFFLPGPPTRCPFPRHPIIDIDGGWALLQAGGEARSRLLLKCSRHLRGPHNQSDAGHFSAIFDSQPVFIDAGAAEKRHRHPGGAAAGPDSYRFEHGAASSHGHNSVLIDGRGQAPSGDGAGVSGRLLRCDALDDDCWVITASMRDAYVAGGYNPVAHALRHLVFHAGPSPFLFVFDDIEAADGRPHAYTRLLHLPAAELLANEGGRRLLRLGGSGRSVRVFGGASGPLEFAMSEQPVAPPFGVLSTMHDTVRTTNPEFWLLAEPGTGSTRVVTEAEGPLRDFRLHRADGEWLVRIRLRIAGSGGRVTLTRTAPAS